MFFLVLFKKFFISVDIVQSILTKIHSNTNKKYKSSVVDGTCLSENHIIITTTNSTITKAQTMLLKRWLKECKSQRNERCAVKCCPLGMT